jgi:hypothetical protein
LANAVGGFSANASIAVVYSDLFICFSPAFSRVSTNNLRRLLETDAIKIGSAANTV